MTRLRSLHGRIPFPICVYSPPMLTLPYVLIPWSFSHSNRNPSIHLDSPLSGHMHLPTFACPSHP